MKKLIALVAILLATSFAQADELRVSTPESIFVVAPGQWHSAKFKSPVDNYRYDTYQVAPSDDRNVALLVTVFGKDNAKFADPELLKKVLHGDSAVYEPSAVELSKVPIKELKIAGGIGFCANFIDPGLVGKPAEKGAYKTATPVVLSLGTNYLLKVTVFCDQTNGVDYQDAIKIIESIKIKND